MEINILIGVLLFLLGYFFPTKKSSKQHAHSQISCATVLGFVLGYRRGWSQKAINKPNEFSHLYGFNWFDTHLRNIEDGAVDSCYLNKLLGYESELLIKNFKEEMYVEDRSQADILFLSKAYDAVDYSRDDERFLSSAQNLWIQSAIYLSEVFAKKLTKVENNTENITNVIKMFIETYRLTDRTITANLSYDPKSVLFVAKLLAFAIDNKELVEECEKEMLDYDANRN